MLVGADVSVPEGRRSELVELERFEVRGHRAHRHRGLPLCDLRNSDNTFIAATGTRAKDFVRRATPQQEHHPSTWSRPSLQVSIRRFADSPIRRFAAMPPAHAVRQEDDDETEIHPAG
jgi:hypothetical protein